VIYKNTWKATCQFAEFGYGLTSLEEFPRVFYQSSGYRNNYIDQNKSTDKEFFTLGVYYQFEHAINNKIKIIYGRDFCHDLSGWFINNIPESILIVKDYLLSKHSDIVVDVSLVTEYKRVQYT